MTVLLDVKNVSKTFTIRRNGKKTLVRAVRGVSFSVARGRTLALVGESGSGKSTTGRLVSRLIEPDTGSIDLEGESVRRAKGKELRALRRRMPMVFQDPFSSLDPTWLIEDILCEPAGAAKGNKSRRAAELLEMVNLPSSFAHRYSYELSGGQRQRISIARALACEPSLMVCDEAVAALDVSTRAGIIGLLQDLQERTSVGYIFITHDLALVQGISQDVAVMYLGRIVEYGKTASIYSRPAHPYSDLLIKSIPIPEPRLQKSKTPIQATGETPSASNLPRGCPFASRCPLAAEVCEEIDPAMQTLSDGRSVACHFPLTD